MPPEYLFSPAFLSPATFAQPQNRATMLVAVNIVLFMLLLFCACVALACWCMCRDAAKPSLDKEPERDAPETLATKTILLKKVDAFLSEHFPDDALTVAQIAAGANLSTGHLNRKMKEQTGLTTEQYLLHYRLSRAYDLLHSTDSPVREVAAAVGLLDLPYFSRVFKRRYGCSPREVRSL